MASLSADQVREKHVRDMGPELGAVYNALVTDVVWLHAKWAQYRQLYARSAERAAFLNKVAGHFFGVIQLTMWEDVLLNLARLTDSPSSRGKDNLTLQRLPELVVDNALALELRPLVEAAVNKCQAARAWRHRRLAHRDLALALATSSDPLPGVSRDEVEAALRAIRGVLDRLEMHYWRSQTAYEMFVPHGGGADSLVYWLDKAVQADEQQIKRLLEGKALPEDLEDDKPI